MVSALVYATGLQDSYFISLYLLVIIVASILFSRGLAFATAAVCVAIVGGLIGAGSRGKDSRGRSAACTRRKGCVSGFSTICSVSSRSPIWRACWRSRCVARAQELEKKREELLDLQDFTEDIIHSMRGGLITTDMAGRIVLLNRTGEDILGYRFADIRGRKLSEFSEAFWPPGMPEMNDKLSLRREIEFRTADGEQRYLGISISPLRSRDNQRNGFVFNFQDLTDFRRLEQEVPRRNAWRRWEGCRRPSLTKSGNPLRPWLAP